MKRFSHTLLGLKNFQILLIRIWKFFNVYDSLCINIHLQVNDDKKKGIHMTIKINRTTGWIGALINLSILVEGKKNRKIKNNETVELEIPNQEATIQAKQWGATSNKITVKDDDELELITTSWGKYSPILLGVIVGLLSLISEFPTRMIVLIIVLALYTIIPIAIGATTYKLIKQETNESRVVSAHSD